MDICTICGRKGHCAAACQSGVASFLRQSDPARPASKSPSTTKPTPSTEERTDSTDADVKARLSRACSSCRKPHQNAGYRCTDCDTAYRRELRKRAKPPTDEYRALVTQAIDALGSERAVCRQLGYSGHGTLHYRLEHPQTIKREHLFALEALLNRVNR